MISETSFRRHFSKEMLELAGDDEAIAKILASDIAVDIRTLSEKIIREITRCQDEGYNAMTIIIKAEKE